MKKTRTISALLAAAVTFGGILPVQTVCFAAEASSDAELLSGIGGGEAMGVDNFNASIGEGSNSYLHVDNQPLGNCVLTLNLKTGALTPGKYVIGFKVRSQVDGQSFRGVRYSVGEITRAPVTPVGEEWISHVSGEFTVSAETDTLKVNLQGDANYFSVNPYDIDDFGVYSAKKGSDGKYITDSTTAVFYNDFEGNGDEYSLSNSCAAYASEQTETRFLRFNGETGDVTFDEVALEAGTYLLRGETRMAYFFNGAQTASTPDTRHTYTEADGKGVVHEGSCSECAAFAKASGNVKDKNDAIYKLPRHLIFGNPSDSEKYRNTSLNNGGKNSYEHIIYRWSNSSEVWKHANYRSLTASAAGNDNEEKPVTYDLVFLANENANDSQLEARYRPVASGGASIHITDNWSAFTALLTVESDMKLDALTFGGVNSALDFDAFDLRNLSLMKGDADEVEVSKAETVRNDKYDILGERTMETHFNKDSGGWDINAAYDSVSGGAMTLTADTPTRNITHKVDTKTKCEIEFRYKMNKHGGECGFKYEFAGQRVFIQFLPNSTRVVQYGDTQTMVKNINQYEYNTYKFVIDGSRCALYLNGEYQFTYTLPLREKPANPDELSFFVNSSSVSLDYVTFESKDAPIFAEFLTSGLMHQEGGRATVKATCVDKVAGAPYVEYYANGTYIGKATADEDYTLTWRGLVSGTYLIEAKYGEYTSDRLILEVASPGLNTNVSLNKNSFAVGEAVQLGLTRNLANMQSVVYYVNGAAVYGNTVTADTVGRNSVTALITYSDGSFAYTDRVYYDVVADIHSGVKFLPSYIAEYEATEGSKLTASDGAYLLDIAHSAGAVTYATSDGIETYRLGLGKYRLQVDGGICDVYYNGQFAFSYRMPVTDIANGISVSTVAGLHLVGLNGTLAVVPSDGAVYDIPDIGQKYAIEFVLDGKKDFGIAMSDGAWETNLTASGGTVSVNTYPNLSHGIVEVDEAFTLEDGKHICRISVVNGLAQIFVDNVWKHSFRMPQTFTAPYISSVGAGTVTVRQAEDLYVFSDSFDGSGELDSSVYWEERDGVNAVFENGAMILSPDKDADEEDNSKVLNVTFDSDEGVFSGDGYSIKDGIMTVKNSDPMLSKNIIAEVEASKDFVLEVRARVTGFGVETGMKLEYPTHRIIAYFDKAGTITVRSSDGNFTATVNTAEWHTYKFVVTNASKCELFIDGESRGTFDLPARNHTKNVMTFFSKPRDGQTTCIEVDSVLYQRKDAAVVNDIKTATLKAISLYPTVGATVKVNEADKGGVYLTARYDSKYNNLLAGYNFDSKKWEIVRNSGASKVLAFVPGEFPLGREVKLELTVEGSNAVLYVDGRRTVSSMYVSALMYGSVGVSVDRVTAEVLDYSYSGTSRPIPGATTVINDAVTPEVFEFAKDNIYLITDGGNGYESADDGITWKKTSFGKYSKNTVRLASGTIVYCVRKSEGTDLYVDYTYVSTDNGETWEGPFPVQSYIRNRITMNCKFTEASSGRLFFVSGEAGHGVEDEGGFRVFYSDDEGRTWKGSNMLCLDGVTVLSGGDEARIDLENTGVNAQECMVVEMPDGTLRVYGRTDEGFLYYSVSTDNGTTWSAEMHTTPIMAVLSAYQVARDPYTGDYYAAWEYNVVNDNLIEQRPRNRVALAVSRDGMKTWEYVGDIHISLNDYQANAHYNIGMRVTSTAVYVDVIHASYIAGADGSQASVNYMVRVDKSTMKTTERFTGAIPMSVTVPTLAGGQLIESSMAVSADGARAFTGDKMFTISAPMAGYVPAHVLADHLGAVCKSDNRTATLTLGTVDYVFTAGKTAVNAGEKSFALTKAPVSGKSGIMIPLTALSDVFGRLLITTTNGAFVSYNQMFGQGVDVGVSSEDLGAYLPVRVDERSASENDIPDIWAISEVNAAHMERITPESVNCEYRLSITRGEFCELIMTMLQKKTGSVTYKELVEKFGFKFENKFTDTEKSYIVAANCIGIVNGRGNGIFDPGAGITRQEAAVMLANAAGVLDIKGGEAMSFADMNSAASWAQSSISTVTSIVSTTGARVMGGVGGDMFDPYGAYSRQQAILTVYRLYMSK